MKFWGKLLNLLRFKRKQTHSYSQSSKEKDENESYSGDELLSRNKEEDGSDSEPESAPSGKRARQEDSSRGEKKKKTVEKKSTPTSVPATSAGGRFITRVWTEEGEIALLKGMIDFKSQTGVDPYADMGAFFDYMKQQLQFLNSRTQMSTKISRMKRRFLNAVEKGENGEDPVFSKPHECEAFDLSKKIWGAVVGKKDKGKSEISSKDGGGRGDFWSNYPFCRRSFEENGIFPSLSPPDSVRDFVMEKMSLLGSAEAKNLEEKWKDLFQKETELYLETLNLMREQTELALGM